MDVRTATITRRTEAEFTYSRIVGPMGMFGKVILRLEPLPRGAGIEFKNESGESAPEEFVPGVERGVREAALEAMDGYSVVDIRAVLTGGAYHDIDSSREAFARAAQGALRKALETAAPIFLFKQDP